VNWKDRFLFVAIPLKSRAVDFACALSLNRLQARIKEGGGYLHIHYECGGGIVLARNKCMSAAVQSEMTDFLFVDADVSFLPEAVEGLLDSGLDFVAGAYPCRGTDWDVLFARIRAGQIKSADDAAELSAQLPIRIPDGPFTLHRERYIRASHVATGFLYLSRSALCKLASVSEVIRRVDYAKRTTSIIYNICSFDLYDTGERIKRDEVWRPQCAPNIVNTSPLYEFVGEDFYLCDKYRDYCGGEVWIDSACKLDHAGESVFSSMTIAHMAERDLL